MGKAFGHVCLRVCKLVAVVTAVMAASMRNSINSTLHCLLLGEYVARHMKMNIFSASLRKCFVSINISQVLISFENRMDKISENVSYSWTICETIDFLFTDGYHLTVCRRTKKLNIILTIGT